MKGKLIVFEGIDGVGKTSISCAVTRWLNEHNYPAIRYEDYENDTEGFALLKPFIKKSATIDTSLLFYLASSAYKSQVIAKLLKRSWVICDRYLYSTLAYHSVRGADLRMINIPKLPFYKPDHLFLLKVPDKARLLRLKARSSNKKNDFHKNSTRSIFAKTERYYESFDPTIIENSQTIDATLKIILEKIVVIP